LKEIPESALVHVTADQRYRLYVNEIHAVDGAGRGFAETWFYDTVEIASFF